MAFNVLEGCFVQGNRDCKMGLEQFSFEVVCVTVFWP